MSIVSTVFSNRNLRYFQRLGLASRSLDDRHDPCHFLRMSTKLGGDLDCLFFALSNDRCSRYGNDWSKAGSRRDSLSEIGRANPDQRQRRQEPYRRDERVELVKVLRGNKPEDGQQIEREESCRHH